MIRFKSIITRIKNTIARAIGVRPSWWKKVSSEVPKPFTPLQAPARGNPQTISLNPASRTTLTDLEFALLTQAPLQLTALEKAKRDAFKIHFNKSSAYANVLSRSNGINVNGSAFPLPSGVQYAKLILEASTVNS